MTRKNIIILSMIISCVSLCVSRVYAKGELVFESMVHDFGDILIDDGPQYCEFGYKNTGDSPVVIHNIISSCGCTQPQWSKAPIRPGESGKIKVTFLNDQGPYPFDKVLTVYNSATSRPVLLRLRGTVHEKKKSLEELYPVRLGGAGLKSRNIDLGQIPEGRCEEDGFTVANMLRKSIEVSFPELPEGMSVSPRSAIIGARDVAGFAISYDSKAGKAGWGRTSYELPVSVNGNEAGRMSAEFLLKPDFTGMPASKKAFAALPVFDKSSYTFSDVPAGEIINVSFRFVNNGREPFEIYASDANSENITVKYPENPTGPSDSGEIRVCVDTSDMMENSEKLYIITLITNSPSRPMVNLFVSVGN